MGELAPWHIIIVLIVLVLVFGSKKLPDLARGMGTGIREFKDGITGKDDHPNDEPPKVDPPA